MGQKPINEGRQMASKIKVIKIRQYTVFPCGVVSFIKVKEDCNNMFFLGNRMRNVNIKTNQMICSAMVFPKTALLQGINRLFTILSIVLHKQLVKAIGL